MIQAVFHNLVQGFQYIFYTQHGRSQFVLFALTAALLAFALVLTKELVLLCFSLLQMLATTPSIVHEYGNLHPLSRRRSLNVGSRSKVVLPPLIEERLETICTSNLRAHQRGAPMRHLLLYGSSGTGKSLVAKMVARYTINLPYAIMSGADMAPLRRRGPLELKRLLTWANARRAVIIIDEAESALRSRTRNVNNAATAVDDKNASGVGETNSIGYARDALNVLLGLTGSTKVDFMLILTTSHPSKLDEAVLNRMDDIIAPTSQGNGAKSDASTLPLPRGPSSETFLKGWTGNI